MNNNELIFLKNKKIRIKATLLNDNYVEIDSMEGKIQKISYDLDSDSDIRRTCNLTMVIPKSENMVQDFENKWNKRVVELQCGIWDNKIQNYVWFKLGRMLMTSGSLNYSAKAQEIKLNLVDLMSTLTPERGSQMGLSVKIPVDTNIRNSIIAIVGEYGRFGRCDVVEFNDTVPFDILSNVGDYPIDLIDKILGLYPYYEKYYDSDGVFVVREIPTKIDDPIDFDYDLLDKALISEGKKLDFSQVKNTTEIFGKQLKGDYVATGIETVGNCYNVTIGSAFEVLEENKTYSIYPLTNNVEGQTVNIQGTGEYPIVTSNGSGTVFTPIKEGDIVANNGYLIKFFQNKFILQGELFIRCIVMDVDKQPPEEMINMYKMKNGCNNVLFNVNPDSPFSVRVNTHTTQSGEVIGMFEGEMKQVLQGGEYESINTTSLAYERGKYENYLACRLQDSVELEMLLIPWMDVNDKIRYTSPITGELNTCIVRSISYDFIRWTMSVSCSKFYPIYPW